MWDELCEVFVEGAIWAVLLHGAFRYYDGYFSALHNLSQ